MSGTPEWLKEKVRTYFQATNEASYLANWSGQALSFHYGLSDETTTSLDEAHLKTNARVAELLELAPGMRVLDAGCGVGGTSIWLAQNRGVHAVGVTLDPNQVELARRFAAERGVADRVEFHVMDYAASTFAPGSFDAVFNVESLCHCLDPKAYLAHVRTLLREGGRYACIEFFRGASDDKRIEAVMDGWAMPHWETLRHVQAALSDAGFGHVESFELGQEVRRSCEQMIAMAKNSLLIARLGGAVGDAPSPATLAHVLAGIAASELMMEGIVPYAALRATR
jgi:cyclopropane fatty-acyl-phospholipid synthase-like methyltransferase